MMINPLPRVSREIQTLDIPNYGFAKSKGWVRDPPRHVWVVLHSLISPHLMLSCVTARRPRWDSTGGMAWDGMCSVAWRGVAWLTWCVLRVYLPTSSGRLLFTNRALWRWGDYERYLEGYRERGRC